nr:GntR family transcriptional regulator [Moorella sulfitireducens]
MTLEGLEVEIKVIKTGFQEATPEARKELQLKEGEPVFGVIRLITAARQPLLLDTSYFPPTIGHLLQNTDLSRDLIYTQLELYGYRISNGRQRISAGLASREQARYLQCKVGSPVLVVRRTTYVEGGLPIDFSCAIYRGDRYEYHVNLQRHPLGLENRNGN